MTLASVLYFADTRFPIERANGLQTMATCQALAARGHEVTLVTRPDSAPLPRDPFEFYGLPRVEGLTLDTVPSSKGLRARRLRFLAAALAMTVRRVHTRAAGRPEMIDAVVQANQRAAPKVDTTTSVVPAVSPPPRYSAQAPMGSRPLIIDGVERARTCTAISRCCRSLRTRSSPAR